MIPASHPKAEELARYIAGHLGVEERAVVAAHVQGCELCRGEVEALAAMNLGATTPDTAAPAPLQDSVSYGKTHQRPVPGASALPPTPSEDSLPAVAEVKPGQEIGRYVVTGQLGRGAMGLVLAAVDPRLQRRVAIKLLRPDVPVVESAQLRARLVREAQALAQLSHPNVVPVHDVGDFGHSVFIAMDYVEGQTLTQWMRAGERPWREVVSMLLQAGQGLAAAHRAGLVHRDFKPDNVLVGADGHVRVSDFGVSRRVRDKAATDEETITGAGSLIGTPLYMSPEQFDAKQADARSDQFSFCVVLYEALYGRSPFTGETLRERRDSVHAGPAQAQPKGRRVPMWLHRLVLKGLSKSPEERFATMEELLALLAHPPRNKKLWVAAGATLLAMLSLTAWLVVREVQRRRDDLCLSAARRVAAVWSSEHREAVKAAMQRTGKPYAGSTWEAAERSIARFVGEWLREYEASCARAKTNDITATTAARVTQLCLESRLRSLALVVEEAKSPELKLDTWLPALADLSELQSCADSEAWVEPENPKQREVFRQIRGEIEQAGLLVNLGRATAAIPEAERALAEARRHGFRRLEANALLVEGVANRRLGHSNEAAKLFEAAALAAEAGKADALLYEARHNLATVLTAEISVERGKAALPGVRTALERVGETKHRLLELHCLEVAIASQEGRAEDAVALQRQVVADTIDLMGELSFRVADQYRVLAQNLGRANRVAEAIEVAQKNVELTRRLYGDDHPFVGVAYSTLGTMLGKEQRNEEALDACLKALERLEPADDRREYQMALYNSGLVYQRLKRLPEAQRAMEEAIAIQGDEVDVVHAQMLSGLAELLQETGQLDKALAAAERSVKMKEKIVGAGSIHLTTELAAYGGILEELGRHEEAAKILTETLAILEKAGTKPVLTEVTRYELARSMWHTPATRNQAVEMVKAVSAWFHAKGPNFKAYYDEADDWLKKHPPLRK
ncbi:MAG: protein kinase [Myxococcota bacterium]